MDEHQEIHTVRAITPEGDMVSLSNGQTMAAAEMMDVNDKVVIAGERAVLWRELQAIERADVGSVDIVLGEAAASARADQAPQPDPLVLQAILAQVQDATPEPLSLQPLYRLEDARALPLFEPLTSGDAPLHLYSDDEREITAFRDGDGRTMLVVLVPGGLAKMVRPPRRDDATFTS